MTRYYRIEGGQIVDSRGTGGDALLEQKLEAHGWIPYVDGGSPAYDADTQYVTSTKVISESAVTETYTIHDYTAEEMTTRIANAKTARKKAIRTEAQNLILADYPLWFQSNAALGVYGNDVGDPMTVAIAAVISASNTAEDAVDACDTLAAIRAVSPSWPGEGA